MPTSLHSLVTLSKTTASSEYRQCSCNERLSLKYNKPILLMDKYHVVDQTSKIMIYSFITILTLVLIYLITQHSVVPPYSTLYKQPYERWKKLLNKTNENILIASSMQSNWTVCGWFYMNYIRIDLDVQLNDQASMEPQINTR